MTCGPSMTVGGLVDGKHKPSIREIQSALGTTKGEMWEDLVRFVSDEYRAKGELVFGGVKYGWELNFRKGGRPLVSMFPGRNTFTVQIVLGRAASEQVVRLELGKGVREIFDNARQLHDGRWLYIPVGSKRDLQDVERLIAAKVESK
jgi:hypothetical protein